MWTALNETIKERDELQATLTACENEVAKVYDELTGGKFTKINTRAEVIIDEAKAQFTKDMLNDLYEN